MQELSNASFKPHVVDWRITSACDLECPFCYGPKRIKALSLPDAMQVAKTIVENNINTVCYSGGEPLLYPHLQELSRYFYENGVKVFLSTDANFFEKHRLWIEKYITKLSLPLDGHTPDTHARAGRTEDNFHNVISVLTSYKSGKPFYIKVGTVVSSINATEGSLIELKKLLMNYPVDRWKIYQFLPEGDFGQENYERLISDEQAFEKAVSKLQDGNTPFKIVTLSRSHRVRSHFLLQPNGDVIIPIDQGILIEEKILGNILTESFTSLVEKWSEDVDIPNYLNNPRFMIRNL